MYADIYYNYGQQRANMTYQEEEAQLPQWRLSLLIIFLDAYIGDPRMREFHMEIIPQHYFDGLLNQKFSGRSVFHEVEKWQPIVR